ncbi:MAG: NAD-dependent epimerase/dehydratase family protein [Proteobacteria bacterium]|nr:NAD-dependent epimerase/dehydratase family protein [Pseudomonadota bacterium]
MSDRRVSVFGGSGFLGRHIVRRLAADGWVVRAAVAGAEAVINLVGILYESGGATFQRIHVEGARADAKAAYARTKAEGEQAVRAAFPAAAILRPSVVFGPGHGFFTRFAAMTRYLPVLPVVGARLRPHFQKTPAGESRFTLFGTDGPRFQPVFVGDVAEAAVLALTRKQAHGRTYELGGPGVYTFRGIMETVLRVPRRKRLLMPVPYELAAINAFFLERLLKPMLTRDQVELLKSDNVVAADALSLDALGIAPQALEAIAPQYLGRFRTWAQNRAIAL